MIAYNYFFVVEADRVNDAIQYLWTVFERLPYNRVREEARKATRASDRSIRNPPLSTSVAVTSHRHPDASHAGFPSAGADGSGRRVPLYVPSPCLSTRLST